MDKYFILYANCQLVKGSQRSVICDLQNGEFEFVPNDLFDLFIKHRIDILSVKKVLSRSDVVIFNEYLDFLISKNLGFYSNDRFNQLIPINFQWKSFSKVTNCILEIGSFCTKKIFQKISLELDELNCVALEIRFYNQINASKLIEILRFFEYSRIRAVSVLLQYNSNMTVDTLEDIAKQNVRLHDVFISNSPFDKIEFALSESLQVIFSKNSVKNPKCCGLINPSSFRVNIEHFSESNSYNSCLNRKISINKEGEIKNCPSIAESFGNIKDTTLEEALNKPGFKKYWNITKDQIEVCKDCEFRYICTDCRAYTERTHTNEKGLDISKPLKCGYNPYTAEWAEWSTNPLKQKAIDYYGLREIIKS